MRSKPKPRHSVRYPARAIGILIRRLMSGMLLSLLASTAIAQPTCPDLTPFYADPAPNWFMVEQRLAGMMERCLENSQFFALIGAAQLNSGQLARALESLERALLIDPDNGAAQIDYAQTLYELGQLFSALDLNEQLLERADLPEDLQPLLVERQRTWQAQTRDTDVVAELLAGHDSNLNGGPDSGQITLTPSGEPILLALSPELRPISGPYLNLGVTGRYRQLSPEHQHNVTAQVRSRVSEDTESDLVQVAGQYAFIRPGLERSWQVGVGMNHLLFGGSPLFSGTELSTRVQINTNRACRPFYDLAAQHQYYHGQSLLNGVEARLGAGLNCELETRRGPQQLTATVNALGNKAQTNSRLGGDRDGWQVLADWRQPLFQGEMRTQVTYTELVDRDGYSPLLANGAERWQQRAALLVQYSRPVQVFSRSAELLINLYHQRQRSNIELFRTTDSTAEVGFSWRF